MSIQKENQQPLNNELFRMIGVVLWVSFVAACIATMLFFAMFDPLLITEAATYPMNLSRTSSYSIGFFLFWLLTSSTGVMVAWLLSLPDAQKKPDAKNNKKRQKI